MEIPTANYSYDVGILDKILASAKKTKHLRNYSSNVNITVQGKRFPNLDALNNPRRVDLTVRSINQSILRWLRNSHFNFEIDKNDF